MNKPLPQAVQRQLQEAEEAQRQLAERNKQRLESQPQPIATPAEPRAPEPPAPPAQPQEDPVWKQRYLTLQGQFNKMVPELQGQVRDLTARLDDAIKKLNTPPAPAPERLTTAADVDAFGADMMDMVERKAREVAAEKLQEANAEISRLTTLVAQQQEAVANVNKQVVQSAQEKFWSELRANIADFDAVNNSQAFVSWLAEEDPMMGLPRQELLNDAGSRLDVKRTLAIFRAYIASRPAPANPRDTLQRQVAPASIPGPAPTGAGTVRLIKESEIRDFYESKRRGRYTAEVAADLESQINAAIAEGRIIKG